MKPENVNPKNFKVLNVLYDDSEFSLAYGLWDGRHKVIAMRWNGEGDDDAGYPKTFGNPMWFIVSDDIKIPILKSLINEKYANNQAILETLKDIIQ